MKILPMVPTGARTPAARTMVTASIDHIDDEVRVAVGLVEETEYARVFERYVTHVMHAIK